MSKRQRRAAALMAAAAVVIVSAAAIYLRSSGGAPPKSPSRTAPDRSTVSSIPVMYDFVTPSLGWAVESPLEPTSALAVFKTTDGGKHWNQQLVRPTSSAFPVEFGVQFVDPLHGFIAAGAPYLQLFITSDGGGTWAQAALPLDSRQFDGIAFIDTSNGWLLGRSFQRPVLYSTENAGATWRRLSTPGDAFGITVRDSGEGWLGTNISGVPHVYLTTDGGATWQRHDLPPPPGISWNVGDSGGSPIVKTNVQVLPQQGVVAVVDNGSSTKYEFRSFNRGATWSFVPSPPGRVGYEDSLHWWAMQGTSLFKSADAGQTWIEVTNALVDWQATPQIIDANHAWAQVVVVGGYGLAGTTDGGLHWNRSQVPLVN